MHNGHTFLIGNPGCFFLERPYTGEGNLGNERLQNELEADNCWGIYNMALVLFAMQQ